jgi:hypothetical protein
MEQTIPTRDVLKTQAKRLRATMTDAGTPITHATALEAVAKQWGYRDWNTLSASAPDTLPQPRWQIAQRVQGNYLGQAFAGHIKAVAQTGADYWQLTLVFDQPIDVVAFDSFSNYRRQVNCVVNSQGVTVQRTSDGQPHVVVRPLAV